MQSRALSTALVCAALLLAGCRIPEIVGSVDCKVPSNCDVPQTICGVDARCIPGCATSGCIAGATCDTSTGECKGSIFGTACTTDTGCDAPEVVCNAATSTCTAGCVLTGTCPTGLACDRGSGRCCDPGEASCHAEVSVPLGCQDDTDCSPPSTICQTNACVAGCGTSGCTAPLACNATSGHCAPADCARDADCDADSICTQAGACVPVSERSYGACKGGAPVGYECAMKESPAAFTSCAGPAGVASCPYCIDSSCFQPGLCNDDDDCSRGESCTGGLCIAQAPVCPSAVELEDVVKGKYGVGKAVCVHDLVTSVRSGYDGAIEVRLGSSPYLYVDVLPMYQAAGVKLPTVGDKVTIHGVVRWDEGHGDRELLPVDWIGP